MNYKLKNTFIGEHVSGVMEKAQVISKELKQIVEFDFNGITILVDENTNIDHLLRDYNTAWITGWKTIGNVCYEEYSESVLEEIKIATEANEKKAEEQQEEWRLKDEKQQKEFSEKVGDSKISITNGKIWDEYVEKNNDPYGKCCIDYARDWGRLMQYYISKGETIVECADRSSHELGWYGITGFMYGAAVMMLSGCWEHGEELKKWHNREYLHEGEGVVNPAVLTINSIKHEEQ